MGWKGAVRSIGAAARAAERDSRRRQRELEREQKQFEKMQELEQAAYEVEVYENHIDLCLSLHKECSDPIDWREIASAAAPIEPRNTGESEQKARNALSEYQPGLISRLFKQEARQRRKLERRKIQCR